MGVTLYTSRVVLNILGITDYGIYNVVGGIIVMFSFLSGSMASATQRFLSVELGRRDKSQLARVFNMSVNIHVLIGLVVLVLSETIGLWFINTQLNVPEERMSAANWVYQFAVFLFFFNIITVPYNAVIIAHERMKVFAGISVLEVVLKLLVVFMLSWFGFDKLKLYAILVFVVSVIVRGMYCWYSLRNFSESRYRWMWDKHLFKTLLSYASWNLWGSAAYVSYTQGINILLNIFFGPAINAAQGVAYQIRGAVNNFVVNFQTAINPQIIKSYSSADMVYTHQLIIQGAKYSFFLMLGLAMPLLLETDIILHIWLKVVPEYTVIFTQLVIANILIDSISGPLMTAAQASGKIKMYQAVVGGLLLLILPISYFFLQWGYPPQVTLYVSIVVSIVALLARLKIISPLVQLPVSLYFKGVIGRIVPVAFISAILPLCVINSVESSLWRLFITCGVSLMSVVLSIYWLGLKQEEQGVVKRKAKQVFAKMKTNG